MSRFARIEGPYRYELQRAWDVDKSALVVVGLNPSTADGTRDDATIRVLVNYARRLGAGRLVMLNLYAWRATFPRDLKAAAWRGEDVIGPENTFPHLTAKICSFPDRIVFAAWGSHGKKYGDTFVRHYCNVMANASAMKCFAVNTDGSPHHPLHITLNFNAPLSPYVVPEVRA